MVVWEVAAAGCGLLAFFLARQKLRVERGKCPCRCKTDLSGKTVIITGANTGIGYFTALDMARRNARVITVCRNRERGQDAVDKITQETGNKNVVLKIVDISSLKQVRAFAEEINREEGRLDILINNAGVAGTPKTITDEGFEVIYATNHFGPFLLTNLLLDLLKKSAPSRIVNVGSTGHRRGKIEFDNLRAERLFDRGHVYAHTKLANMLFTRELAERLAGTGVTVNVLHPGAITTEIWRELTPFQMRILLLIAHFYFKTPEEGAQTTIHCAVSPELASVTGKYFISNKIAEDQASDTSRDMDLAKKLWAVSEQYTGLVPSS